MATRKEYQHTKNYIHNELGFKKEFIEEAITKYLDKIVGKMISEGRMENLIIRKIGETLTGEKEYRSYDDKAVKYIKSVIKDSIKEEVVKRINFDKIDVT